MEKKFFELSYNEQESIINACMMNSAKMINSMQTINENKMGKNNQNTYTATKTYRDCVQFLYKNHDELFNESYINCMDMANNDKYKELPIALFVSKACGKAINKYFYASGKSASELIDTETQVNIADSFNGFEKIFDTDRIESIIENIRIDLRKPCKATIDCLIVGYNYSEIAKMMNVSVNTISKYVSAIVNAIAIVNALDKEWNALDKIIAQDISFKDSISRKLLEKAIIKAYQSEFKAEYDKAISWQVALDRLKAKAYYTSNQSSLANAFYSK